MSSSRNSPFAGLDPGRQPGIADRYRKKMPSLKGFKGDPCADLWVNLMHCYTTHDFNQRACAALMFDFNECARDVVRFFVFVLLFFFVFFFFVCVHFIFLVMMAKEPRR
jgi:hypothetical protein